MDNRRAMAIIDRSNLSARDKSFITTHLEVYQDLVRSLQIDILTLKDTVEYGQFLDNKLLTAKEIIINLANDPNKESIAKDLQVILEHLQK